MTGTEIAALLGTIWRGDAGTSVARVSAMADAAADCVVFAEDTKALGAALASAAGVILASEAAADLRVLQVRVPKLAFAQVAMALTPRPNATSLHPAASVAASTTLGARVQVAAGAVVEDDCVLGDDVVIAAGAKVLRGTQLGSRVVVQAGAVLGATGFGYVRDPATGEYLLFPQQGTLIVEDDVEIGANSTIDRGALGETRIGRGTKIDNLVHIGHNCRIGKNVVIAAQVGISGSCVIEDGAILAGQVGISDHCHIGPGVILGGQAGVYRGATVEGQGQMFAGTPAEPLKDHLKGIARVRRLK
jgi:UDP-3-O-[3-hydroxymyristoyl] glucosamine N-acyltransferase